MDFYFSSFVGKYIVFLEDFIIGNTNINSSAELHRDF